MTALIPKWLDDYNAAVAENSAEFIAAKREIEENFGPQFRALENYRKSKREIVLQEALYAQQLKDDEAGSE
jgi:hypothetical protein